MNWRRALKDTIKETLARPLHLPFNKAGVPVPITKYLPRNAEITLVDVGAHRGLFVHTLSQYYRLRRVVMCEALPKRAAELREKYAGPQFSLVECAVGDRIGTVEFECNEYDDASSLLAMRDDLPQLRGSVMDRPRTRIQRPMSTLDEILAIEQLGSVDLLKLDVQGAEHLVLAGAALTLPKTRLVWTEVSYQPLYEGSHTFAQLHAGFEQAGFQLEAVEPSFLDRNRVALQADALFVNRELAKVCC